MIAALLMATITACGNRRVTTITDNPEQVIVEDEEATGDMSEADHIIISKETMRLKLYDKDDLLICSFPIAIGKHLGDKQELGDCKTPEGDFSISEVQQAIAAGFTPIHLGRSRLRTETAGLVAVHLMYVKKMIE